MTPQEFKLHNWVKIWNVLASLFFLLLCLGMWTIFIALNPNSVQISILDIAILSLANFRLIRLFVYDNMTLFIREMFMDIKTEEGNFFYVTSKNSFKLTMHKLTTCPWCFGVWLTFVSAFIYFTFPVFKILFILLGVSAIASFLIIVTNLVGWYAEGKKKSVENI